MKRAVSIFAVVALVAGFLLVKNQTDTPVKVVLMSEVKWEQLNPARGDKSPKSGALWGDRTGTGPSGFLVKFVDGFRSPPHIHNVAYRGVVIEGSIHNSAPDAEEVWMSPGSFWTQPAGGAHITAAGGGNAMAYIEIEEGPYLVLHVGEAFQSGDNPVNLDASSIAWVSRPGVSASAGLKTAALWGSSQDNQPGGALVNLPAGFAGVISSRGSIFRAVVIQGRPSHQAPGETGIKTMEPGSYFGSGGESAHLISCGTEEGCILYVRAEGGFNIIPTQPEK
ncbi:MAG: DUF4437 domain-containing protein [Candidatus Dadabacteria bacterium]|nr:DUF4437 domain-containing protein [Candidatus Dadabacteria bacterium]